MKHLATTMLMVFLCMPALAEWTYQGSFPNDSYMGTSGAHGAAVDPDGKVWLQIFGNTDSVFNGTNFVPCLAIHVFNPDGSPASFSPIKILQGAGINDTLTGLGGSGNRGIRTGADGNIIASVFNRIYRINYQTGAALQKMVEPGSIGSVGVDTLGEIFVGRVAPGNPIKIYDQTLNFLGNVVDTSVGFHRSFEVSSTGDDVFWAGYTEHAIYKYHSDNGSFGPYVLQDTVLKGFDCESMTWNPSHTILWASSGSANDRPNRFPGLETGYDLNTWYAYNPATGQIVDSLKWNFAFSTDSANLRPRAIAFSPDGNTAYVGCFGSSGTPAFQKFTLGPSSVKPDENVIPTGFTLQQNYPNPFNPETHIRFEIVTSGLTTVRVYDLLGREVASLVNENLSPGAYDVPFNASHLASGTYVYTLGQNGRQISKKMLLVR